MDNYANSTKLDIQLTTYVNQNTFLEYLHSTDSLTGFQLLNRPLTGGVGVVAYQFLLLTLLVCERK